MQKVLFLDIDGVILSGEELWKPENNNRHLPPHKIALVKEVCDRTGAVIVVSSTWRFSDDTRPRLLALGLPVHTDWRTPYGGKVGSIYLGDRRGGEIAAWLHSHPEISCYAIVDDDSDMLETQLPRFVQTPFVTGIDRAHVEQLVAILNSPAMVAA